MILMNGFVPEILKNGVDQVTLKNNGEGLGVVDHENKI
jgi:hypothetical protein